MDLGSISRFLAALGGLWNRSEQYLPLMLGIAFMALSFFSLLFALSWGDVSMVGPASASLTFVANAFAAKLFLHEKVDRRRWTAAACVAGGVFLLAG